MDEDKGLGEDDDDRDSLAGINPGIFYPLLCP